jgi:competence protein ComEC
MLTGALAAAVGALHGAIPVAGDLLAWAAGGAAWLYLRLMIVTGHVAAGVPMASVQMAAPAWLAGVWYPLLLLGVRRRRSSDEEPARIAARSAEGGLATQLVRPRVLAVGSVLALLFLTAASRPDGRLHVMALDVGQGDAILVVAPTGQTLLVDGGPDPDLVMRRLGEKLPVWQRRLDMVLLTHPHEDHVAGLVPALERFEVGTVLDSGREYENPNYDRFVALADEEGPGVYRLARAGQRYRFGAMEIEILYPTVDDAAASLPEGDINNASVVVLLRSGSFAALLEGDAEAPVEASLLERGLVPDVDLLKVGHHGSESSSTPAFLAAARPQIALISCGVDNEYGHPHAITLEHLAEVPGLVVRRTDLEGSIDIAVDGTGAMGDAGMAAPGGGRPRGRQSG